jgi:hypothetical protein
MRDYFFPLIEENIAGTKKTFILGTESIPDCEYTKILDWSSDATLKFYINMDLPTFVLFMFPLDLGFLAKIVVSQMEKNWEIFSKKNLSG